MSWRASLPGMCLLGMTGRFLEDLCGGSCGILTDSRFRLETLDDSLQPTIDMLLNVTIFMWYVSYSMAGGIWLTMAGMALSALGPALCTTRWSPSIASSE